MPSARAAATGLVRATARRLVPFVSQRPWMVSAAARVFALAPGLKRRLRHFVSGPVHLQPAEHELTPSQAAVLVDLRQAVRDRRRTGRP